MKVSESTSDQPRKIEASRMELCGEGDTVN